MVKASVVCAFEVNTVKKKKSVGFVDLIFTRQMFIAVVHSLFTELFIKSGGPKLLV